MENKNNYSDPSLKVSKKYLIRAKFEFLNRVIFYLLPTAQQRVAWLKKKKKFALLGEHVHYQPRKYPTASKRVKIHNNVAIAADVEFTEHDVIHWVFNGIAGKREYSEFRGCIEIHDNVFIGAGARILPNVSIGPNAIVAAGSLVNKDVLPGTIVAGVPARVIGDFDSLQKKRAAWSENIKELKEQGRNLDEEAWRIFYEIGKEDIR